MLFNPYTPEQTAAACNLLEIFHPEIDDFSACLRDFELALDNTDNEDAPIYEAIVRAFAGEVSFCSNELKQLAEQLEYLASRWGVYIPAADLLYSCNICTELLSVVAAVLAEENLSICLFNPADNSQREEQEQIFCGFFARSCDLDLVEKLSQQCGAEIWVFAEQA